MVSDFDFIRIHAAARKSKQRHGCFLGNLPYLPRPPAGPFPGRGCHRLRPALPHHSPARAVASPELTNTEGTSPKSLTGREKVSLYPVPVIASGLPQPGLTDCVYRSDDWNPSPPYSHLSSRRSVFRSRYRERTYGTVYAVFKVHWKAQELVCIYRRVWYRITVSLTGKALLLKLSFYK